MNFRYIALVGALLFTTVSYSQDLNVTKSSKKNLNVFPSDTVSHAFLYRVSPARPYHVCNPSVVTFSNQPTKLPDYGKRCMFIFYVDPDGYFDNRSLEKELKQDGKKGWEGKTYSPKIKGYGILNLADTKLSSSFIRGLAKMVLANAPSVNLADNDHSLRDAWKLPNVNNKFVIMLVTKEGDMVFYREGPLSESDKKTMYDTMQKYRY